MTALVEFIGVGKRFDVSPPWLDRVLGAKPRQWLHAADGVGFTIERGRTLALVGESGSGKSTLGRMAVGLMEADQGDVLFDGKPLSALLSGPDAMATRRRLQMVFQDPYASLNPRWTVAQIVAEPLVEQGEGRRAAELSSRVEGILRAVGLSPADSGRFPHQFSGGQRQRIAIGRAMATSPDFIVCDEPTSALDVSVQAQVLNLMKDLQQQRGLTYLFISHNLAVVRHMSDEVAVMYLGRLVERAPKAKLFSQPRHPYTRLLLDAIPDIHRRRADRVPLLGDAPDPLRPPTGCAFHPRCPHASERCRVERPLLSAHDGAWVACHAVEENRI